MNTWIKPLAAGLLAWATAVGSAQAATFAQLQPAKSQLTFAYTQMGVTMNGRFTKMSGQVKFDPAKPEAAQGAIDVDLASIDTGSGEGDSEVQGKAWFNVPAHPKARFELKQLKAAGPNRYDAVGQLSIKGQSRELKLPLQWSAQDKQGQLKGSFVIKRGDFRIGEGSWSAFDIVANDVNVAFVLTVTP